MSQRRNPPYTVNDSSRNSNTSNHRPQTSVLRDFNESILSKRLTFTVSSLLSYVKSNVKEEHKKEESINNEDVNV